MLIYLAWDGSGFWTVLRHDAPPFPRPEEVLSYRLLGRVDGLEDGLRATEGLNAWLASRGLARVRRSFDAEDGGRAARHPC